MSKVVLSRHWKSKGQAKHFTTAKARKAARLAKAWKAKSK